jgi:hypothetical protein
MYKERLIGSIACGPAVLWDADEVAMAEFMEKTKDMNIDVDIHELFHSITSCTCTNMTGAAQILFIIVNSLTKEHSVYLEQRARITEQQAKIAELIIEQKNIADSRVKKETRTAGPEYPIEREKELVICLQNGNMEQSKKILNILLGEIFSFADGNPVTIKVRLFELIAFFSRAAVETGAPISGINQIAVNSFNKLHDDLDFEQICFLTSQAMEGFAMLIGHDRSQKNISVYLSRAVDYIMLNYAGELTRLFLSIINSAIFACCSVIRALCSKYTLCSFVRLLTIIKRICAAPVIFVQVHEVIE